MNWNFKGSIAHVIISNVARSDAWIAATYASDTRKLITIGNEE